MSKQTEYAYDVFISYSQYDQQWVLGELLPRLEKVSIRYIHQLQFELGRPKLDEIERSIKQSRRTLLVLTPSYLQDTWGQFDSILVGSYGLDISGWPAIPAIKDECELPVRLRALVSVDLLPANEYSWQRLITALSPQSLLSSSSKQARDNEYNSHSVRKGLGVLTELMSAPEVRDAVVAFRTDFQAAREQIDVLGNYKDLHDLLHKLEFQCYSGIVQEARRFLDDKTALDILIEHEFTLEGIVNDVRDVAVRASLATNKTVWVQDLVQAHKELQGACEDSDRGRLDSAVKRIRRVLAVQPTRINTSLNTAADALRLPALVSAMMCVRDQLADSELDPDKVNQFQDGVNALDSLNQSLKVLINNHSHWQDIDVELRRIEGTIEQDISELEMFWPELKAMTESLYSGSTDEWPLSFQKDSEKLDSAIAAQNPAKAKQHFRSYRRRAGKCFYQVDMDLKRFCGDLRTVGEPLAFVLRMIE